MIDPNAKLHEQCKIVSGLPPINPSSSTPDYVCMKGYVRCSIILHIDNGVATGGAVTIKQATNVGAGSEKALAFTEMYANEDTAATDTLVATAVTSDTFTPSSSDNKMLMYVMDVSVDDLDTANGFDCIRAGTADATAAVTSVLYILYPAPYARAANTLPTAITDPAVG